MPITSCPCCFNNAAATAESTPPDMATTTRKRPRVDADGWPWRGEQAALIFPQVRTIMVAASVDRARYLVSRGGPAQGYASRLLADPASERQCDLTRRKQLQRPKYGAHGVFPRIEDDFLETAIN